jgi:hypothetical protein
LKTQLRATAHPLKDASTAPVQSVSAGKSGSAMADTLHQSPRALAQRKQMAVIGSAPVQRKLEIIEPGVDADQRTGAAPVQRVLAEHLAQVGGAKGDRKVFKDSVDDKYYARTPGFTADAMQVIEVTLSKSGSADRYTEVGGAVKKTVDMATMDWAGAAAPAPVAAATGWTVDQMTAAGFVKKAGTHYQKDEADFEGYHVHVSGYKEAAGFTSFHVKFDSGTDHISWFYSFASGGSYDHPGQSLSNQKLTIKNFAEKDLAPTAPKKTPSDVTAIYDSLVAESERIAAAVVALL